MSKVFHLLFLLTFFTTSLQSQYLFKAEANARKVVVGNTFTYSVTLEQIDSRSFRGPDFQDFNVVSGPSTSMSSTTINGVTNSEFKFVYTLQPKQAGEFVIPAATAMYDNKKIKSNLVKIVVLKGKGGVKSQNELNKNMSQQMFVRAVPSSDTAYIGQQVLLEYKIYYAVNVKRYDQVREPTYDGFFVEKLRTRGSNRTIEVVNGEQYNVSTVKTVALYPQRTGKLEIEASKFKLGVNDPTKKSRSIFFEPINYFNFATEPLVIDVLELPKNAPASFSGAVGKYTAQSVVSPSNLTTDDALTIKLEISGNGDVKRLLPPDVIFDDNLEVYSKSVLEKKSIPREDYMQSYMSLEYTVLPQKATRYLIKPEFTYFDPDSAKYITIVTGVDNVMVRQGTNKKNEKAVVSESDAMSSALKPLLNNTALTSISSRAWIHSPIGKSLFALPFLAMCGILIYRRNEIKKGNIDPDLVRRQQAADVAKKRLSSAEAYMKKNESKLFFDEIAKSIFGYIGDKMNIPFSELSRNNIANKLHAKQAAPQTIEALSALLERCEMARFAGVSGESAMQEVYTSAHEIIASLENK